MPASALATLLGAASPPGQDQAYLPPAVLTEQALCRGGDSRVRLGAEGRNAYACSPRPEPGLLAWGSSTASVVSDAGFAAARALHQRLLVDPQAGWVAAQRIRSDIGLLSGAARVPGTEVVLAASGTDVHLIATQLQPQQGRALHVLMAEPGETGRGVSAALAGCHFDDSTCQGRSVSARQPLDGLDGQFLEAVALRQDDGTLRTGAEVDGAFHDRAVSALRQGRQVLLVLTDLSKSGLLAPSPASVSRLQAEWPGRLQVLVDACQFRLAEASVADYLARGWLVALTGSKFVGGPAFCGALLLPPTAATQARSLTLTGLAAYSCRTDWPATWLAAQALPPEANAGLLLRWEAALCELRAFRALPPDWVAQAVRLWGEAISARVTASPWLQGLSAPALQRVEPGWDAWPTIFPFTLQAWRADGVFRPLSPQETTGLHHALRSGEGPSGRAVQLGQPVACGRRDGVERSALRVCIGLRNLCEAAQTADGLQQGLRDIDLVFDEIEGLVCRL